MDIKQIRLHNLRALIAEAGTIARLARLSSTAPAYLSQILNSLPTSTGRPRSVGDKLARKLEQAMEKPYGWMDQGHEGSESESSHRLVPLLSGDALSMLPQIGEFTSENYIPIPLQVGNRSFALRIADAMMEPRLSMNDYVIIDPDITPTSSDLVLIHDQETGTNTVMQYLVEGNTIYLISLRAGAEKQRLESKQAVLGRAVYRCGEL